MSHYSAKITTIGNSVGVVLPKELLAKMKLGKGDQLFFTETPDGYTMRPLDPQFVHAMELAEKIMRDHRDVLRRLAE